MELVVVDVTVLSRAEEPFTDLGAEGFTLVRAGLVATKARQYVDRLAASGR